MSTPRQGGQKTDLPGGVEESEAKKLKQTPVKGSSYLGWRVGDDVSHHMEQTIEEGDRAM